jgi:hypothetical protein
MRACLLVLGLMLAACSESHSSGGASAPVEAASGHGSATDGNLIYVKCEYTDNEGRTGVTFYRIDESRQAIAWWFDDPERTDVPQWDERECVDDSRKCDFQATLIEQNWSAGEWGSSLRFNRLTGDYSYSQWNGDGGFVRSGHCEPSSNPGDSMPKKF